MQHAAAAVDAFVPVRGPSRLVIYQYTPCDRVRHNTVRGRIIGSMSTRYLVLVTSLYTWYPGTSFYSMAAVPGARRSSRTYEYEVIPSL